MGSKEELLAQIHKVAMKSCRILYICADMLDPKRKTISKKYLSELKAQAQELQKEADKLPGKDG